AWAALLLVPLATGGLAGRSAWFPACVVAVFVFGSLYQFAYRNWLFRLVAAPDGLMRGRRAVNVENDGLWFRGPSSASFVAWHGIRSVETVGGQVLVDLDGG